MKKLISLALGMLLLSGAALAQTTLVTATVTDSDSTIWANGTWKVDFTANSANPYVTYYFNGVAIPSSMLHQSGSMNSSGVLSFTVDQNSDITPAGSSWTLTVCPDATSQCDTYNFTATGASMDLSTALTAAISAPRFKPVSGAYGYADVEAILALKKGSTYWNVTLNTQRCYTGSTWISCGGTNSNPGGNNFAIQYNNNGVFNGDSGITTDGSGNLTAAIRDNGGQVVNVKAYGAKGDGTTNDTAAIAAAMIVVNNSSNACLFFPPGTFLTDTITFATANVCMEGAGINRSNIKSLLGNTVVTASTVGISSGIFKDLSFLSNGGSGGGIVIPASLPFAYSITVERVTATGFSGPAIYLPSAFNVRIVDSQASSVGNNAFDVYGAPSCLFENDFATDSGNGYAGYRVHNGACSLISANGIDGSGAGESWGIFGDNTADGDVSNLFAFPVIISSNIESFTKYGIQIRNGGVRLITDYFLNNSPHSTATVEALQMHSSGSYQSDMDSFTTVLSAGSPSFGFTNGYAFHEVGNACMLSTSYYSPADANQPTSCYSDTLALAYNIAGVQQGSFAFGKNGLDLQNSIIDGEFRLNPGSVTDGGANIAMCAVESTGYRLECSYNGDTPVPLMRIKQEIGTGVPGDPCSATQSNELVEQDQSTPPKSYICSNATGSYAWNAIGSNVPSLVINGDSTITAGPRAFIQADTGNLTSIVASGQYNPVKVVKSGTIENIVGTASAFTCSVNPTITLEDCGTSAGTCASPTALGSATVTAANTSVDGTITSATITAGHYLVWETTAGTCTSLNLSASAEYRMN